MVPPESVMQLLSPSQRGPFAMSHAEPSATRAQYVPRDWPLGCGRSLPRSCSPSRRSWSGCRPPRQTDTGPRTAAARALRRDVQWPSSGPPPAAELTSEREEPEFDPRPDLDRSTELTAGFEQRLHESEQFAC